MGLAGGWSVQAPAVPDALAQRNIQRPLGESLSRVLWRPAQSDAGHLADGCLG